MKTIIIIGSDSDIGIAAAKALIEHPVKLALHYYSNQAKAEVGFAQMFKLFFLGHLILSGVLH
jgi:hypothetical protein